MGYMEEKRKIVSNIDGLELDFLCLIPEGTPKGIVQIHHGMSEHKERYLPFMEYLANEGFVSAIHDCRGHGKSIKEPEDLGYMYGVGAEGLVEDAHQITLFLKEKWPELPLVLFGHSMGSLVVRMYAKKYDEDLDMLIVCGSPSKNPYLKLGQKVLGMQKKIRGDRHLSKLMEAMSFGAYAKKFAKEKSRFAWCCSNETVVQEYEDSSLCGFTFSVDGYQTLLGLMEETYSKVGWNVKNPQMPVLFVGGSEDPCIGGARKYAQAVQFMRLRGYKKTKGRLFPKMRHEILNETDQLLVFQEIKKYIEKNVL